MKQKLFTLLISLIAFSATVSAQTGKGAYYLGGSLSYDYNSFGSSSVTNFTTGYTVYTTSKVTDFSISPEYGFFLSNKWSIGIQPSYSRTSGTETSQFYATSSTVTSYTSSDFYHNDQVGLGINVRYYWMITDKFGFFPQGTISTSNNAIYFKYGTFALVATPNFVFFPTPKIGVNLGFGGVAYNLDYQTNAHTFAAALNNKISFGLNYYWGKK